MTRLTAEELQHPGIQAVIAQVPMVCGELSNAELAALNLAAQLDQDPRGRIFNYDKVSCLFTEAEGMRMHDVTKQALASISVQRLTPPTTGT